MRVTNLVMVGFLISCTAGEGPAERRGAGLANLCAFRRSLGGVAWLFRLSLVVGGLMVTAA